MKCPKCSKFMKRINEGEMMDGWMCSCGWFVDFDYSQILKTTEDKEL